MYRFGRSRVGGFTLVELLVVIGIIALLVSMLMPALAKARASAVQAQCLSGLRQTHVLIMQYATEQDGYLPWRKYVDNNATPKINYNWYDLIDRYSRGQFKRTRMCPEWTESGWWNGIWQDSLGYGMVARVGTKTFGEFYQNGTFVSSHRPIRFSSVRQPADRVFIGDSRVIDLSTYVLKPNVHRETAHWMNWDTYLPYQSHPRRHMRNASACYGFFDGHAVAMKPDEAFGYLK